MKPTRFLLAGCGTIGERHARLAAEKGVLVAVCDIDEKKAKAFSAKYDCYRYSSLNDMLIIKGVDVLMSVCR
ncbi:Gfo/Idh/MocA family oxidoreductase [Lacibacter sp.]|uniref:Gfo/Idh/MocA family oxidoreductase n=1 Tax=Lacibacter sp. TaxID=1915409 RepID=UPI002B4B6399|nr:Gfo/Idh/MocA family oxidoreductase [Lacibacter sp.]HLP36116.1 Gfo/Idh/MocA family oxidoreductase [Lacibacter sp.]